MKRTTPVTFSDNVLYFSLPDSWEKLTQEQLRYVCHAMSNFEGVQAKTYMFIRLLGIKVLRKNADNWTCLVKLTDGKNIRFLLDDWQVQSFLKILDFIDTPSDSPVCLQQIGELKAVNVLFRGVSFGDYIRAENHYQGYLHTNDIQQLRAIATILYVDKEGNHLDEVDFTESELLSVFLWYASLKNRFASEFSYFFGRAGDGEEVEPLNMVEVMNAEIRALTGGDITKENQVLSMDCWRALTELNEKARETKEWNQKNGCT